MYQLTDDKKIFFFKSLFLLSPFGSGFKNERKTLILLGHNGKTKTNDGFDIILHAN